MTPQEQHPAINTHTSQNAPVKMKEKKNTTSLPASTKRAPASIVRLPNVPFSPLQKIKKVQVRSKKQTKKLPPTPKKIKVKNKKKKNKKNKKSVSSHKLRKTIKPSLSNSSSKRNKKSFSLKKFRIPTLLNSPKRNKKLSASMKKAAKKTKKIERKNSNNLNSSFNNMNHRMNSYKRKLSMKKAKKVSHKKMKLNFAKDSQTVFCKKFKKNIVAHSQLVRQDSIHLIMEAKNNHSDAYAKKLSKILLKNDHSLPCGNFIDQANCFFDGNKDERKKIFLSGLQKNAYSIDDKAELILNYSKKKNDQLDLFSSYLFEEGKANSPYYAQDSSLLLYSILEGCKNAITDEGKYNFSNNNFQKFTARLLYHLPRKKSMNLFCKQFLKPQLKLNNSKMAAKNIGQLIGEGINFASKNPKEIDGNSFNNHFEAESIGYIKLFFNNKDYKNSLKRKKIKKKKFNKKILKSIIKTSRRALNVQDEDQFINALI